MTRQGLVITNFSSHERMTPLSDEAYRWYENTAYTTNKEIPHEPECQKSKRDQRAGITQIPFGYSQDLRFAAVNFPRTLYIERALPSSIQFTNRLPLRSLSV